MDISDFPILTIVTFLPLVGAIVVAVAPSGYARPLALGTAILTWVFSLLLLIGFSGTPDRGGLFQFVVAADWIPLFGIQYKMGVDGLSVILVVLTTTLTWISILASFGPIKTRIKEYMASFLILEVGMIGVFVALDLFLFYIFWEIVLVPMYLIIGIWGGANRIYATIKFVLYTLVGSLLMLVAILATAFAFQAATGSWAGAFDFVQLREFAATSGFADGLQLAAFLAFFLAFAIKVPMFPFHTWLPDAHTDAPTAGSVILAAVLLKMGTYGFLRFSLPILPDASRHFVPMVVLLSIIGIVYGALVALAQKDWKRLVAYSSVSHMALVMLGMFALNPVGITGSIIQQLNHGISTGALFLLVGVVYERRHTREIAEYGGLSKIMPVYAAVFLIMTLSSIGLPTLNGFIGEILILQGVFVASKLWAAFAASGIVLGATYMLYLYQRTMFGKVENPKNERLPDLTHREFATFVPLIILAVWIGLYPSPFLRRLDTSVQHIIARVNPQYAQRTAAADCGAAPVVTASSGASRFLAATPCGPDGKPLPAATSGEAR
jgi:NADH-quinone oxidoreductase subunit M